MVEAPVILPKDIEYIADVHSKFVSNYTKTEWLNPKQDKNLHTDFVTPLIEKFKLFKLLLDKASDSLHYTMDSQIVGSLSVLVAVAQNHGEVDMEGRFENYNGILFLFKQILQICGITFL